MIVGQLVADRIMQMLPPVPPRNLPPLTSSDALRREVYAEGFRLFSEVMRTNASWVIHDGLCEHSCWAMTRWAWEVMYRDASSLRAESIARRAASSVGALFGGEVDDIVRSRLEDLGKSLMGMRDHPMNYKHNLNVLDTAVVLMYIDVEVLGRTHPAEVYPLCASK